MHVSSWHSASSMFQFLRSLKVIPHLIVGAFISGAWHIVAVALNEFNETALMIP